MFFEGAVIDRERVAMARVRYLPTYVHLHPLTMSWTGITDIGPEARICDIRMTSRHIDFFSITNNIP